MNFQAKDVHGIVCLTFWGVIYHEEAEDLRAGIRRATHASYEDLVWDFTDIQEMAPRCFGVLAFYFAQSVLNGFRPVIIDPGMEVLSLAYSAGMDLTLEFVRNMDEAFEFYLEGLKVHYNRLFCQILLERKYITPRQLQEALVTYNRHNKTIQLGKILTNLGYMTAREVVKVLTTQRSYLGEILVEQNIISKGKLNAILREQAKSGGSEKLGDLLQRLGLASNKDIYEALHTQFKRRRRLKNA